ncbi:response regulator [Alienimonas chondri]|uniref:Regulator of RpoS n=1 Tax=Alienimonas chondri TaxID=2681879 RepID=A0ABX1VCK9_9PLAN|nr:response regulator [Alienimonas chondri]NNJ25444.1 Regulator of RpoS [Alienimonas chondri]
MPLILIVDDNPLERAHAKHLLEKAGEWRTVEAEDGAAALRSLAEEPVDLILTDLKMPGMNGLELIDAVQERWEALPTVLMTAEGSEEIACEALRLGASNYVAKRRLAAELPDICRSLLEMSRQLRSRDELMNFVAVQRVEYSIPSDRRTASDLARFLQDHASHLAGLTAADRTRLGVALEEAVLNAVIHGNLEVSSELRERGDDSFDRQIEERRTQQPYADRRVTVSLDYSSTELVFEICDEGPGFDVSSLPDPTDPENLLKASGRGIMLMRAFMDRVEYSDRGNRVVLKRSLARPNPSLTQRDAAEGDRPPSDRTQADRASADQAQPSLSV